MARGLRSTGTQAGAWNPANILTLLVPAFASLMLYRLSAWALGVFVLAALTDLADGWLARRFGWVTALGAFIDPMADKLLQLTAVTILAIQGLAPPWVAVLLWSRETVVVSGFAVLAILGVDKEVRSSGWGKASTMGQMAALAACLAVPVLGLDTGPARGVEWVLGGATVCNFLSGLEYAWKGFQAYESQPKRRTPKR